MKRSEMVKKLSDAMTELSVFDDDDKWADNIVKFLEEQGMRPPRLSEDYCQAIMDIYIGGCSFNQWDEDIEKDEKVMKSFKRRQDYVKRT